MFGINRAKATPTSTTDELVDLDFPGFEEEMTNASEFDDAQLDGMQVLSADTSDGDSNEAPRDAQPTKQSSSTQAALGALSAVEEQMREAKVGFEEIESAMSAIRATHQLSSRLAGGLRAAILKMNELEEANAGLAAENRNLSQLLEQAKHQQGHYQAMNEASKRRIELLIMDYDE